MQSRLLFAVLAAAVAVGCAESVPTAPERFSLPVQVSSLHAEGDGALARHAGVPHNFRTHASGGEEVPPNASRAQGQATFQLSADGDALTFQLIVANILNVTQAHIHLAPAGVNGPVVAWLYPDAPPAQLIPGRSQGILSEGVITVDSLVGPLAGQPLEALLDAMRAGNTYVNVHTSQFPPGEVRGQIF